MQTWLDRIWRRNAMKAWNFCCNKCAVAVAAVACAWGEATADGVVSFKDAATIKSWDA